MSEDRPPESEQGSSVGGWLPPEPPGPRPQLGERPQPAGPPPGAAPPGTPQPWAQPPPAGASASYPPPAPAWPQQGPVFYQPPTPPGPGNDAAVAGFVLSLSGVGLLFLSAGFAAPLTLLLAVLGIVYGRWGRRRVDAGETTRHRGLGQAGFIIGIVTAVLSVLAALGWTALFVFTDDLEDVDGDGGQDLDRSGLSAAALALLVRLAASSG